jgi:MFS family permease
METLSISRSHGDGVRPEGRDGREEVRSKDRAGRMTMQQRLIVLLLLGAGFMLSVDFSILNVALPQVGAAVGLKFSQLPWIATAYALPAAGFTLLFGRIADLFGRRRMFLTGIALMGLSSIFGGLAMNPFMLLLARVVQGFSTAIAMPAALSLLITSFNDERQRARVLGFNGALRSGGFTVGALLGGALVGELSWRWAFLINVPVAILILAITPFVVRKSRATEEVRLRWSPSISFRNPLLSGGT